MENHNYNLSYLDNMVPWEREIYVSLLEKHIQKENEKMQALERKYKK